jgi:DNA-binding GntR family transcriptional regulator
MRTTAKDSDFDAGLKHHQDFHEAIDGAFGNQRIASILGSLRDTMRGQSMSVPGVRGKREVAEEHLPILTAIKSQNPQAAALAMEHHLVNAGMLIMQHLSYTTSERVPECWPNEVHEALFRQCND